MDRVGSTRITGNGLLLTVDGVDYWADCSSVVIEQDSEPTRQADGHIVLNRGVWTMSVSAIQSTAPSSLWMLMWKHEFKLADYTYAPHGNDEPTSEEPHFTGRLQLPSAPQIGGEAGRTTQFSYQIKFRLDHKPALDTGTEQEGEDNDY